MILDNYLSFDNKVFISMIAGAIWIYSRTYKSYDLLKRKSMLSIIFVVIWIYLNYYEPLFLPVGLIVLYIYAYHIDKSSSRFDENKSSNNILERGSTKYERFG